MGKRAAALLSAMVAVALFRVLIGLGLACVAWPAVIATALGSSLWSVASQALWEHGPAALLLTLTMLLLKPGPLAPGRMFLGGLAAGLLVVVRSIDVVFALVVLAWVARAHPRS